MINTLGNDMGGPANVRNACALGVLAMLIMSSMILTARIFMGKKMGALFRV
jgi:DMSO/TMAO reductase YedYZ heme-binding membrane subunit